MYCRGITEIIGSGGRYDDLIKKFGSDMPATGFALDIDMLHGALGEKELIDEIKIMLLYSGTGGNGSSLMGFAGKIRDKGIDAEVLLDDVEDSRMLARDKGCRFLVESSKDLSEFSITDIESGDCRKLDSITFLKEIEKWKKN